jgi:hypothetical protein
MGLLTTPLKLHGNIIPVFSPLEENDNGFFPAIFDDRLFKIIRIANRNFIHLPYHNGKKKG